jgi:hypothetical protein
MEQTQTHTQTPIQTHTQTTNLSKLVDEQLENIKSKQPNIYNLWKVYLHKKQSEYNTSLMECLQMLNSLQDINKELSITDLQTILIFRNMVKQQQL